MQVPECIEGERLILRRFREDEPEVFVGFLTRVENTTEFMFSDAQKTEHGASVFFTAIMAAYNTNAPYFLLAITLRTSGLFIGMCGISSLPESGVFEPFCCLSSTQRGNGYAMDAMTALIDHCFARKLVNEFRAYINSTNERSTRMAERLGFHFMMKAKHPLSGDASSLYGLHSSNWRRAGEA